MDNNEMQNHCVYQKLIINRVYSFIKIPFNKVLIA